MWRFLRDFSCTRAHNEAAIQLDVSLSPSIVSHIDKESLFCFCARVGAENQVGVAFSREERRQSR